MCKLQFLLNYYKVSQVYILFIESERLCDIALKIGIFKEYFISQIFFSLMHNWPSVLSSYPSQLL